MPVPDPLTLDRLLVDTDICIDVTRNYAPGIARLDRAEQDFILSVCDITHMELLIGCANNAEQQRMEKFLRRFESIPIDAAVSQRAVDLLRQYRLSHGLLLADAIIAATALVHNCPLLTKNQRDFRFIAGLRLHPLS